MNFNLLPSRSFTFHGCFHYLSDVKPCGKTNNEQKKGGQKQIVYGRNIVFRCDSDKNSLVIIYMF